MEYYDSSNRDKGYNIDIETGRKKISDESKLKMSIAKKGKPLSKEHKLKLSESGKGRKFSEEHKINIGNAKRGEKNSNYGKPLPDATKAKLSTSLRGENNPKSKLREEDVLNIRNMLKEGIPQAEIARMYGVTRQAIFDIKVEKRWKHLRSD